MGGRGEGADAVAEGDGGAEREGRPAVARAERARGEGGDAVRLAQVERAFGVGVGEELFAVEDEQVELVAAGEIAAERGEFGEALVGREGAAEGVLARADAVERASWRAPTRSSRSSRTRSESVRPSCAAKKGPRASPRKIVPLWASVQTRPRLSRPTNGWQFTRSVAPTVALRTWAIRARASTGSVRRAIR